MTQGLRTAIYLAVALVVGVVAFATRPGAPTVELDEQVGDPLFPDLKDPSQVASVEIIRYDKGLDKPSDFKVALVDGAWAITSHHNYPADDVREIGAGENARTESRVADVAGNLIDLEIVGVDSSSARDHEGLGVVEPDLTKIEIGAAGVGTLVALQDAARQDLARLIIGKPVDDAIGSDVFGDQKKLYYVRRAGQDQVYRVALDPSKLSTRFDDWIKKDLLEIDNWNVTRLTLNDYGVLDSDRGGKIPDIHSLLTFDFKDSQWTLAEELVRTQDKRELQLEPAPLSPDEEPASQKLNDLKFALEDLQIVDVDRKPAELAELMRKGHPFPYQDPRQVPEEALLSLDRHGFYFYPGEPPRGFTQLFSDAGDFLVSTGDGVEYLVRFGSIVKALRSQSTDDEPEGDAEEDGGGDKPELNRFVMVTARFNPDAIAQPVLKPYPDASPAGGEGETEPLDAEQTAPAGNEQPAASDSNEKSAAPAKESQEQDRDFGPDIQAEDEPPAQPATETEAAQADAEKSEGVPSEGTNPDAAGQPPAKLDAVAEARKKIDDENKKAQQEYEKKIKEGEEKAAKLNARFADWYFVVSEDAYKKLRLSRNEAIQKKGAANPDNPGPPNFGAPPGIPNFGAPMQ